MSLPRARYIILHHDGEWKINLDNRYYGPFPTKGAAIDSATQTAREARQGGYPASVLLMADGKFETLWEDGNDESAGGPHT